jgi:hypothetical protein
MNSTQVVKRQGGTDGRGRAGNGSGGVTWRSRWAERAALPVA